MNRNIVELLSQAKVDILKAAATANGLYSSGLSYSRAIFWADGLALFGGDLVADGLLTPFFADSGYAITRKGVQTLAALDTVQQ